MASHRALDFLKLAWLAFLVALLPVMAMGADGVGTKPMRVQVPPKDAAYCPWGSGPCMGTPVPAANCGATDWTETGLQGATTTAERMSGLSELGFQCNLELVGQYQGQGSKYMMTWFGDCAY